MPMQSQHAQLQHYNMQWIDNEDSETSLIRHSMGPENNVGLGGCWIMEYLFYLIMLQNLLLLIIYYDILYII